MIPKIGIIFLVLYHLNFEFIFYYDAYDLPNIILYNFPYIWRFNINKCFKNNPNKVKVRHFNVVKLIQRTSKENWNEIKRLYLRVFLLTLLLITQEFLMIVGGGYFLSKEVSSMSKLIFTGTFSEPFS